MPYRDRRLKAILVILLVWAVVSLLHWQPQTQWLLGGLTLVLAVQIARLLLVRPLAPDILQLPSWPVVSILIAAQNEQAVLPDLIPNLLHLDYPLLPLDLWVIDDGSQDASPQILQQFQTQFPALQVRRRVAQGGKPGALNAVFPDLKGEIMLVCDADARLPDDFLQQTVPWFRDPAIAAVQVRKSIANASTNFWTRCQQMEMSCDCFLQRRRLAVGGMTELRGNGTLVRRSLLEQLQGWNEDTLTEDLDLTFRAYLTGAELLFVENPPIQEEGVENWPALWQQRCRWAEGGYQRYLDYFPQILTLGWAKEIDLGLFFLLQFVLPIGLIPDLVWAIVYRHSPVLWPLQMLLAGLLTFGLWGGLRQFQGLRGWALAWAILEGSLYMLHWIPVMIVATLQLCRRTQPPKWIRTEHRGCTVVK